MNVYVALLYDSFYGQEVIIGVYDTEEKAGNALDIILEQKYKEDSDLPEARYDSDIVELQLNCFNHNMMWMLVDS